MTLYSYSVKTKPSLVLKPWLLALALAPLALADPAPPAAADKVGNKVAPESEKSIKPVPAVREISPGIYKVGKVTITQKTQEIAFPAYLNTPNADYPPEYLLVHTHGEKIHEALLQTPADPLAVNIALKLLKFKESKHLFRAPKEDGTPGTAYHQVPDDIRKASMLEVRVHWQQGGEKKSAPITSWLQHSVTKKPMPNTAWVYNGSYVHKGKFKAKLNGNILSLQPDFSAIANYGGEDREKEHIWMPAPKIPREGTKVTVSLRPWKE